MENKSLKTTKSKNANEINVIIEKDFSVINIEELYKELKEIVNQNEVINLELKNIENFDLSSIQLIYSLRNSIVKLNLKANFKDDIKNIFINSGFKEIIN